MDRAQIAPRGMGTTMARFDLASAAAAGPVAAADGAAYFELACLHASGRGMPTDLVQAHKWFNVAAMRGYRDAVARRAEIASEMSSAEIAEAQREARLHLARV